MFLQLFYFETLSNCPVNPVTENEYTDAPKVEFVNGCLVITVTENGSRLWSLTLSGREVLDQDSKDAVFYQLAMRYNWLETKKEKTDFLIEIETIILPKLNIEAMHRKSLIRKLRNAIVDTGTKPKRGRKARYGDFDKHHLVQIWKLFLNIMQGSCHSGRQRMVNSFQTFDSPFTFAI